MITYIITGIIMGIIFGFVLEKSRAFEPGMMIGQFQFRNFIMLKVFLTAVATTLVVVGILYGAGAVRLHPKEFMFSGVILGGLIFGAGMALSGGCPGTILAQAGAGYKDAWAVFIGGICGAMFYGYLYPVISSVDSTFGKIILSSITKIPFTILAFIVAAVIVIFLCYLEKVRPWRGEMGENFDGYFK